MKECMELLTEELQRAFAAAGYDEDLGRAVPSNRPDLCEVQCNGAMAGAKRYHKAPLAIAADVAAQLAREPESAFSSVEAVPPGFLNLRLRESFLADYLNRMAGEEKLGLRTDAAPRTLVLDYGGPNVAKPLHVGHLRSAVIGEAIKRIARYNGETVISDIHMGDWGLQMGLILTELHERQPQLPYFDSSYEGTYPEEPPFTVSDLEEIYPCASKRSKEDAAYYAAAMDYTHRLQEGERGLRALWEQIVAVSVGDLRKNYEKLSVDFDLWLGESDAQAAIPGMVERLKREGYAHESDGALVVDVAEEQDAKELPPCIILKSDGAALYTTTDLATIVERVRRFHPDEILYVTDKRQELHFRQVFRCARKCGLVPPETTLTHIGFGTMNGKDGKPFKTREGGVMRLEHLIADIDAEMLTKIRTNREIPEEEAERTARQVALAALKYGDLSNQASKDYIFDMERFTSFEGDTGPYILYTIVRIRSILEKSGERKTAGESSGERTPILPAEGAAEKDLMRCIAGFSEAMRTAHRERAPHRLCAYVYELSNAFNSFYHETKILTEENAAQRKSWLSLLALTERVLTTCIGVLGFAAPERM